MFWVICSIMFTRSGRFYLAREMGKRKSLAKYNTTPVPPEICFLLMAILFDSSFYSLYINDFTLGVFIGLSNYHSACACQPSCTVDYEQKTARIARRPSFGPAPFYTDPRHEK